MKKNIRSILIKISRAIYLLIPDEFNFSSNPTYSTGSKVAKSGGGFDVTTGLFKVPSFQGDPRAYITQVGLYDNNNDLLAVAKLSQPVLKSFSREAVVKVKLDY